MLARWSVSNQEMCERLFAKAANVTPPIVRMSRTYGNDAIVDLVAVHITDAVMTISDCDSPQIDNADVRRVAQLMVTDSELRVLPMGVLLAWFYRVKCRRYHIWGRYATPQKLLECLQQQRRALTEEVWQAQREAQREREEQARREHRRQAVDWKTYAAMRGIPLESLL